MASSKTHEILQRMYETSEWSDLEIVSSDGGVFNVHKSVVCAACPFFRAACDDHWREGRSGIIELPEDAVVLDALLRHCYGISEAGYHLCVDHTQSCWIKILEILIAANKYHLPELEQDMRNYYTKDSNFDDNAIGAVEAGIWVYQEERRTILGPKIVKQVVREIAWEMQFMVQSSDTTAWEELQSCPELLKDVMRFVASSSNRCWSEGDVFEEPEYLREPETGDGKSSTR